MSDTTIRSRCFRCHVWFAGLGQECPQCRMERLNAWEHLRAAKEATDAAIQVTPRSP